MSHHRKKILVFSDWYLPGYKAGGPIRSLANLVRALDLDFYIVTRNTDHDSSTPYEGIESDTWIKSSSNVHVYYFSNEGYNGKVLRKILSSEDWDKIYFNSLFSPRFTLWPIGYAKTLGLSSRIILAPRGMLQEGALSIKGNKKKLFLSVAKMLGWYNGIVWHATSAAEKKAIEEHFGSDVNIHVAPNLSTGSDSFIPEVFKEKTSLKLLCIARLSPEKGILEALQFLKAARLPAGVIADFYGTQQNESYLRECTELAERIEGAQIKFPGEINPDRIPSLMENYHFFYLPTRGENYGHAIVEALVHSLPVIISNLTPWQNLEEKKAGWDLPLENAAFVRVLKKVYAMDNNEYLPLRKGASEMGKSVVNNEMAIQLNLSLFV